MPSQLNTSIVTVNDVIIDSDIKQGKITNEMKICFNDSIDLIQDRQDPEYYTNKWGDQMARYAWDGPADPDEEIAELVPLKTP